MKRGKQTCRILKEIRRQIAEANDIAFITSECQYKGDCLGTCPKCEAEVRYLEQELEHRRMTGKLVTLAGISAGMLTMNAYPHPGGNGSEIILPAQIEVRDTAQTDSIAQSLVGIIETMPEFPEKSSGQDSVPHRTKAVFPGGIKAMLDYLKIEMEYPLLQGDVGDMGRAVVDFEISKDGKVERPRIRRSLDPILDRKALEHVWKMPRWIPATENGSPVSDQYTVPVRFVPHYISYEAFKAKEEYSIQAERNTPVYGKGKQNPPDTYPEYPGGTKQLAKDMTAYVRAMWERFGHPEWGFTGHGTGRTTAGFIVETNGSISNIEVLKSIDPALDKEAIRFVKQMPRWTPGTKDGKIVRTYCVIPISFRIQ